MPAHAAVHVLDLPQPAWSLDPLGPDVEPGLFAQLARCRINERLVRFHAAVGSTLQALS
jgi:hypothetical protein